MSVVNRFGAVKLEVMKKYQQSKMEEQLGKKEEQKTEEQLQKTEEQLQKTARKTEEQQQRMEDYQVKVGMENYQAEISALTMKVQK